MRPARALTHPCWWAALALLVANDHLFKGSGVLPPTLTGKLSDFAGMLVAPALLATLARVRTRAGFARAHLAIGVWFGAINLWPPAARAWEAAFALTPFPWATTVDPTDLMALPFLGVSLLAFTRWCEAPAPLGVALARLGVAAGSLACIATSPPPPGPYVGPPPATTFPNVDGRLALANRSELTQVVRVRALKPTVRADCAAIERDPDLLTRDLFAPATTWLLDGQRALGLGLEATPCGLLLVDGPGIPARLVSTREFSPTTFSSQTAQVPASLALYLDATPEGVAWAPHPALRPAPSPVDDATSACGPVPEGFGVTWSLPPVGDGVLLTRTRAPDGCEAFDLIVNAQAYRWFACYPALDLPFDSEDPIRIRPVTTGADGRPVDGVEVVGPRGRLILTRGSDLPGVGVSQVTTASDTECTGTTRDACGGVTQALAVQLVDDRGERVEVAVGETLRLSYADLVVARAALAVVADTECTAGAVGVPILEAAAVHWAER